MITVSVPSGCYPGGTFSVEFDGRVFSIDVPDGCRPGDEVELQVPNDEEPPDEPPAVWMEHQQSCVGFEPQHLVGRRVELYGLIANALLNGRKGTVLSSGAHGELVMCLDGLSSADVFVMPQNVRPLPEDDAPDADNDEPPEAPAAGAFYVGDLVHVLRSNGSTSLASVVEYDEVLETYVLDVGRGLLKYGVEESYITPVDTTNEWAGPMERVEGRWQGFFHGRRVRIPTMLNSSEDDDKNGVIMGYDQRTGFYHVELDSGVMRRSVLYHQIKIVYQLRSDEGARRLS